MNDTMDNSIDAKSHGGRLASIDALRGFDMFFITGGANIVIGLCAGLGFGDCWIAQQMKHVSWAGLAHHDTIFPLFLFHQTRNLYIVFIITYSFSSFL